jgi:hypothetical protein
MFVATLCSVSNMLAIYDHLRHPPSIRYLHEAARLRECLTESATSVAAVGHKLPPVNAEQLSRRNVMIFATQFVKISQVLYPQSYRRLDRKAYPLCSFSANT